MANPKVSVIVPVYRVEDCIDACIQSLLGQTLRDIEVIFVDDLGGDGSMDIVRRYQSSDPRIKVVENERNCGPGQSRNHGIASAQGDYLAFVDSDDHAAPDFLERLYSVAVADDLDVAKGTWRLEAPEGGLDESRVADVEALNAEIRDGMALGVPLPALFTYQHQAAIYRRALLAEHDVRYGTSVNGEDTTFLLRVTTVARSIGFDDGAIYYYVQREGSAVHSFSLRRFEGYPHALQEKVECFISHLAEDERLYGYIAARFRGALSLHAASVAFPETEGYSESYLSDVRDLALRIPHRDWLMAQGLDMRALVEDGCNILIAISVSGMHKLPKGVYAGVVSRWLSYLDARPSLDEECILEFRRCVRLVLNRSRDRIEGCDDPDGMRAFLDSLRQEIAQSPRARLALHDDPVTMCFVEHGANLYPWRTSLDGAGLASGEAELVAQWIELLGRVPDEEGLVALGARSAIRRALKAHATICAGSGGDSAAAGCDEAIRRMQACVRGVDVAAVFGQDEPDIAALAEHGANLFAPADVCSVDEFLSTDVVGRFGRFLEAHPDCGDPYESAFPKYVKRMLQACAFPEDDRELELQGRLAEVKDEVGKSAVLTDLLSRDSLTAVFIRQGANLHPPRPLDDPVLYAQRNSEVVSGWVEALEREDVPVPDLLMEGLKFALQRALRSAAALEIDPSVPADAVDGLLQGLRSSIGGFSGIELIKEKSRDLRLFVEEGINVVQPLGVSDARASVELRMRAVDKWLEFLRANPEKTVLYGSRLTLCADSLVEDFATLMAG